MSRGCIVDACIVPNSPDTHKYRFPKHDSEIFEKWLKNLKINRSNVNSNTRICSRHFDVSCIGVKRLLKGAIPTLNLGHDDDNLNSPELSKWEKIRVCSIKDCKSKSPNFVLHTFPNNSERRRSWVEACGLQDMAWKELYICNNHFDPAHIKPTKRLTSDAFPRVKAEHSQDAILVSQELQERKSPSCDSCEKFRKQADYSEQERCFRETKLAKERLKAKKMETEIENMREKIGALELELQDLRRGLSRLV